MSLKKSTCVPPILLASLLGACAAPPPACDLSALPDTEVLSAERVSLRSDEPRAPQALFRELVRMHAVLDAAYPWLADPRVFPTVSLSNDESYRRFADRFGADPRSASFNCPSNGMLVFRARSLPPSWVGAPEIAAPDAAARAGEAAFAAAEAVFRQRLDSELTIARQATALERGAAQVFAVKAAEGPQSMLARRFLRSELAREYFSIMLGAERGRLAASLAPPKAEAPRPRNPRSTRPGPRASPFAAALFLTEPFEALPEGADLEAALLDPSAAKPRLAELEDRYERFVRDRLIGALLEAIEEEEELERSLAESALLMATGRDIEAAAKPAAVRRGLAAAMRQELAQAAPPVRLLDGYRSSLLSIQRSRLQRKGFDRLLKALRSELKRREGYFDEAVEAGRRGLPKAIERELKRMARSQPSSR